MPVVTVGDTLAEARRLTSVEGAILTATAAQALLAHVVGRGRAWLLAHPEAPLSPDQSARFLALLGRAADGEPLAQLVGEREFYGLPFAVTPDVLIPRPETESLVDAVLAWAQAHDQPAPRLVDVGTGSGAIAITLALKLPQARVFAVEVSPEALAVARCNAARHGVAGRVGFVLGNLLGALSGPFDAIIANLPYVNSEEIAALEVGRWEPRVALDGGADGLDLIRALLRQAPARLAPGGLLALEIGYDQGALALALCCEAFPAARVTLRPDLAGLARIVTVAAGEASLPWRSNDGLA